jgi:hypothetical protein
MSKDFRVSRNKLLVINYLTTLGITRQGLAIEDGRLTRGREESTVSKALALIALVLITIGGFRVWRGRAAH